MANLLTRFSLLGALSVVLAGFGGVGCSATTEGEVGEDAVEIASDESELTGPSFQCPGYEKVDCTCKASRYNCQFPNEQKGRNRFLTLKGSKTWGVKAGTPMVDGAGNLRGTLATSKVMVNFGQRKTINGKTMIFAFAAKLNEGLTASSWIEEAALTSAPLKRMPTVTARNPPGGDEPTPYYIKGGVPENRKTLKVVRNTQSANEAASDYFERPGGVVYLLYNLPGSGGAANDAFKPGTQFMRVKGMKALQVELYKKGSSKVVDKMPFVYGHVGDRYGWLAAEALTKTAPAAPATPAPPAPSAGDPAVTPLTPAEEPPGTPTETETPEEIDGSDTVYPESTGPDTNEPDEDDDSKASDEPELGESASSGCSAGSRGNAGASALPLGLLLAAALIRRRRAR